MDRIDEILTDAKDAMTVSRVYGEPYEKNGVTLIPAAAIMGGVGTGEGEGTDESTGRGGGYGMRARPVGAYKIDGEKVTWIPAVDTSRIVLTGQIVGIVALLVLRSIFKRKG
ncbi:MAG: hypothetical protein J5I28_06580 [Acidimicrobiales bacterium]|nr:hypothetical protein [Acidimicrobiales bacterium]